MHHLDLEPLNGLFHHFLDVFLFHLIEKLDLKYVQIPEKNAVKWKISKIFFNRLNKNFTESKISANN